MEIETRRIWIVPFGFGLIILGVGLMASVDAREFKANAFGFCAVNGLLSLLGSYCFRRGWGGWALGLSTMAGLFVLGYYLFTFINAPEQDANLRVALAILSSIATLAILYLPRQR